jgi:hypothetical protein
MAEGRIIGWNDRGQVHTDDLGCAADEADCCAYCGGLAVFIGTLGRLDWYRCKACGMEAPRAVGERTLDV